MRYPQLFLMMNVYSMHDTQSMWDCMISYHVARMQTKEKVRSQATWYTSGSFPLPLYISVTDVDDQGRYLLYYEHQTPPFTIQSIDEIHTDLMSIIGKGIENPDIALKNI